MIGILVEAPEMLNATGDNVARMIVERMLGGKEWINDGQGF